MSIKIRYCFLATGCIAHATFLAEMVRNDSAVWRIFAACPRLPANIIGLSLLCLWPAWSFFLWKYGLKRWLAVVIPMLAGLAIMWRVLYELLIFLIMICFPNAIHM